MLETDDIPPYEILNPEGPAPLLIACDHAQNRIPESLNGLGVDPAYLEHHIAYDIGARQVSLQLSEMFDAPLILGNYSRLVVDLNRHLDDPTLLVEVSDGIEVPGNQGLTPAMREQRIRDYFHPYHDQYASLVSELNSRHQNPIILAVHSFTPTFNGQLRPWDFGVLWDKSEQLALQLIDNLSHGAHYLIGNNQPYHANEPRGYAQDAHGHERGVEFALLEIRQDLITDIAGQRKISEVVYDAVKPLTALSSRQLYGKEHDESLHASDWKL